MRPITPKAVLFALILSALACGITDRFTGGGGMKAAPDLWDDVPRMDGITKSDGEMPAWLRLMVRPVLNTMMRGVNNGKDAGDWDVVFFVAAGKTPKDVRDFYTPERMATYGWERKGDTACMNLNSDQAMLCGFIKNAGGKQTGLVIISAQDDQKKETSLFFLRNEVTPTPTPNR